MSLAGVLDKLFLEEDHEGFSEASDIVRELDSAKQQVLDLQNKLDSLKKRVLADLTIGIKSQDDGMNISLDNDQCTVGRHGQSLGLKPDFNSKVWVISSPDPNIMRSFGHDNDLSLSPNFENLISGILKFFQPQMETRYHKGKLMLEGRSASLIDVVKWKNTNKRPLNSRLRQKHD